MPPLYRPAMRSLLLNVAPDLRATSKVGALNLEEELRTAESAGFTAPCIVQSGVLSVPTQMLFPSVATFVDFC